MFITLVLDLLAYHGFIAILCREYQVVHQNRCVVTLVDIFARPRSLRRKWRGNQPEEIEQICPKKMRPFTQWRMLDIVDAINQCFLKFWALYLGCG